MTRRKNPSEIDISEPCRIYVGVRAGNLTPQLNVFESAVKIHPQGYVYASGDTPFEALNKALYKARELSQSGYLQGGGFHS